MVSATVLDASVQPSQKLSHQNLSGYQLDSGLSSTHTQSSHLITQSRQAYQAASLGKQDNLVEKKSSVLSARTLPAPAQAKNAQRLEQSEDSLARLHLAQPTRRVRNELVDHSSVPAPIRLPRQPRLPPRLRLLHQIQQGSAVLTGLLIASALVAYGSSVFIDKSTDRAIVQLNALRRESQQLATANESIKQSMAEQASREDSGLEFYESDDMLFITPEPRRAKTDAEGKKPSWLKPLGY